MVIRLVIDFHLYIFLIISTFSTFYALSGAVMLHEDWFPKGTSRSTSQERFEPGRDTKTMSNAEARILSQRLAAELHLRGRLSKLRRRSKGNWHFVFERPGTIEEVELTPGQEQVKLTIRKKKFAATMNRLHHLRGFEGGGRFFAWGLLVDIVSISLILFAASGIYLWYATKKDHLLGWVILGGSTAYILGSILFLLIRD